MAIELTGAVAAYVTAVNASDRDAILALFVPDAYVNDNRREITGLDAIGQWVDKEILADHVTMEPREVLHHHGETILRSRYDGTFDKTNLPAEVVLTDYYRVVDERIVSLHVIFNQPSPY